MDAPTYSRTQHSPLWALPLGLAAALLALAVLAVPAGAPERWALLGAAAVMAFVASTVATLTVRDAGDRLLVRYGPLPLFGTSVRYADVRRVEPSRSRLIDGWGIHWVPGRGWTFNLWGMDCVELRTERRRLRIGTTEPRELARLVARRAGLADPAA